jgi:hypothetical protein
MTTYIQIPKNTVPKDLQEQIISQLPKPIHQSGQRFRGYQFRNLGLIETKDPVTGATDNTARAGGTGEGKEELTTSLAKGILPDQYPPSLLNDLLKDGFNRVRDLIKLGYTFWVFAVYEDDPDTRTKFQSDAEDSLRDGRLSLNPDYGKKAATDDDFVSEGGARILKGSLKAKKDEIIEWVNTIDHNFSNRKVSGIANRIISNYKRQGKIEYYSREEAEKLIHDIDPSAVPVNTKDATRVLRVWKQIMENAITTGQMMPLVPFSSGAVTHQGWDDEIEGFVKAVNEIEELTLKYAALKMVNRKDYYSIPGGVDQKIQPGKVLNKKSFVPIA